MRPKQEIIPGKESLFLLSLSADAERRLAARLLLSYSNAGLETAHLPLGGSSGIGGIKVGSILDFFEDAREGFRMYLRGDRETNEAVDFEKLLTATTSLDVIKWLRRHSWRVLPSSTYGNEPPEKPQIERSDQRPYLPAFQHIFATLVYLRQQEAASLSTFRSPFTLQLGEVAKISTFWVSPLTLEYMWETIERFQSLVTDAIYKTGRFQRREELLETAVFFSAGRQLAQSVFAF